MDIVCRFKFTLIKEITSDLDKGKHQLLFWSIDLFEKKSTYNKCPLEKFAKY